MPFNNSKREAKVCKICSTKFIETARSQKYCSAECTKIARKEQRLAREAKKPKTIK